MTSYATSNAHIKFEKSQNVMQKNDRPMHIVHAQIVYCYFLFFYYSFLYKHYRDAPPSPLLDNIRVMVIVWRLRGNIIRTAPCWVVWHNVHSQQHTHMSSAYRSSRLGLSHWDPYAMHRGGCLELYYCNMVECCWWDSSLICKTNWFPSVLWHCWFGHMTCKNRLQYDL